MSPVKVCISLFAVVVSLVLTSAQFPAVCVGNATLPNSTCCPIPPGFTEPCGGPTRGRCVCVQLTEDLRDVPNENLIDDRFDWPTNFFENVCTCFGNFSGYMCQECWYGNTGTNCNEQIQTVRKEISTLTPEERERFISLVQESMLVPSDYMILNTSQSADPTINPQFLNVSEFQYLSYLHYYVSRKTNFRNESMCDDPNLMWPDFAHGGPAFPLWHRLFTLKWERVLRQISGDETFSLPYWDWINAGGSCSVCTDEWFGAQNPSDPFGTLSRTSAFSEWRIMCNPPGNGCQVCDPYEDNGPIIRNAGGNPRYRNLPTREAVDYAMSLTLYDLEPYSVRSPNVVFRNVLEGFANADGPSIDNSSVHNLVHSFLNGTMSELATAAMDPIFLVHHTFVDKLFEIWRLKNKATARQLPLVGAQPGHNRHSYLVPFFPLQSANEMFRSTDNFGYTYDNLNIGGAEENNDGLFTLTPSWIAIILEAGVILVLLVAVAMLFSSRRKSKERESYPNMEKSEDDIDSIYGVTDENRPIMKKNTYIDNKSYDTYGPIG